jgi:serine/threonine protein kinase
MSPEQIGGSHTDQRSDLFSLGTVFYEMATGHHPFAAHDPMGAMIKILTEPFPLPNQFNPKLPGGVEQVLLKALSKRPEDRYQTASEMIEAINTLVIETVPQSLESVDLMSLRKVLVERFDLEELRTLCFDLGENFDSLRGEGQEAKAREWVAFLQRRERLSQLASYIRQHRPDIKL